MPKVTAALDRFPWTTPVLDGVVKARGIELDAFTLEGGVVSGFRRMVREQAFDVCELGITTYLASWDYERTSSMLAIFLAYQFPQRGIFYNLSSGIREPKDLEGKRIGGRTYTVAGIVWARGMLADVYGVDIDSITWVINDKEHQEDFKWPKNVEYLPGADLGKMFEAGELDAGIGLARPGVDHIRPLVEDPEASERVWFESAGIYPINHVLVVKNATLEAMPEIAASLYATFSEAKQVFLDRLASGGELEPDDVRYAEIRSIVGPDPVPFGIEANRTSLEALVRYAVDQHIISESLPIEELFIKSI